MADHPSATLLIRVWLEEAGEFRARLLTQGDATAAAPGGEVTIAVAWPADAVLDAVRNWLDGLRRRAADPAGDGR